MSYLTICGEDFLSSLLEKRANIKNSPNLHDSFNSKKRSAKKKFQFSQLPPPPTHTHTQFKNFSSRFALQLPRLFFPSQSILSPAQSTGFKRNYFSRSTTKEGRKKGRRKTGKTWGNARLGIGKGKRLRDRGEEGGEGRSGGGEREWYHGISNLEILWLEKFDKVSIKILFATEKTLNLGKLDHFQ